MSINGLEPHIRASKRALARRGFGWVTKASVIAKTKQELLKIDDYIRADALYDEETDKIYVVYPPMDQKDLTQRVTHEYGHRLWSKFMSSSARRIWADDFKKRQANGGPFVTWYSQKRDEEDFCEVFALWVLDRLPTLNTAHYERLLARCLNLKESFERRPLRRQV